MMTRQVWIKTIGDNASIAITDHGKRRVTLPNSSTSAPPRPLRNADGGLLLPADDLGSETIAECEPILRALAPGSFGACDRAANALLRLLAIQVGGSRSVAAFIACGVSYLFA
jgi:hypothetical protein